MPVDPGATLDLWDRAQPMVVLVLREETTKRLTNLLQESVEVGLEGPDSPLYAEVYRPLLEAEQRLAMNREVWKRELLASARELERRAAAL